MRASLLAAAAASLALAAPAGAAEPVVDLPIDCGGDTRSSFDFQPDVDYPVAPPRGLQPILTALGCPEGEPQYEHGAFFQPPATTRSRSTVHPPFRARICVRRVDVPRKSSGKRVGRRCVVRPI